MEPSFFALKMLMRTVPCASSNCSDIIFKIANITMLNSVFKSINDWNFFNFTLKW